MELSPDQTRFLIRQMEIHYCLWNPFHGVPLAEEDSLWEHVTNLMNEQFGSNIRVEDLRNFWDDFRTSYIEWQLNPDQSSTPFPYATEMQFYVIETIVITTINFTIDRVTTVDNKVYIFGSSRNQNQQQ
ncbi:unnamed protein product [Caenorhabditis auriculariae]|uniref:MADF domain-containing protein n=1 Tax=Caenorhabditis auriculariae TaxID=2777116 RepID=A0A8S1GYE3_9PELO|nr:unnamed protein product [Caenorhabditis auriculariae]